MWKNFKDRVYFLKVWWKSMTGYPLTQINLAADFDYDEYWKKKRGENVAGLSAWQKRRAETVRFFLGEVKEPISIGDIGSGSGSILVYLRQFFTLSRGLAYDSSVYALEGATQNDLETVLLNLAREEDLAKLRENDYHFLFEILEHVPASEKLLGAAYDKSSKGVFFSIPNTGFFIHRFRLMFFGKVPMQWRNFPNEHVRFWTITDLKWWLKALGYANYKIAYYAGVPILRNIWPNLFCSGMMVYLKK